MEIGGKIYQTIKRFNHFQGKMLRKEKRKGVNYHFEIWIQKNIKEVTCLIRDKPVWKQKMD